MKKTIILASILLVFGTLLHAVSSDFNANGSSDILLKKDNGDISVILMGTHGKTGQIYVMSDRAWSVQAIGDFDANGYSDILFKDGNNALKIQFFHAGGTANNLFHLMGTRGWHVEGVGDFNNDRTSDILFRKKDGSLVVMYINSAEKAGQQFISNDIIRKVEAVADFDGNGYADILFIKSDGARVISYLGISGKISNTQITGPRLSSWSVKGTGDFNYDGQQDILFQKVDGTNLVWLMGATGKIGKIEVSKKWDAQAVGDYNGDGNSDILFKRPNSSLSVLLMNRQGEIGSTFVINDRGWTVQPLCQMENMNNYMYRLTNVTECDKQSINAISLTVGINADFPTIQEAVDAAQTAGTKHIIHIQEGHYNEAVTVTGNNISLCGEGNVTLSNNNSTYGVRLNGTNLVLQNIDVYNIVHEKLGTDHGPSGVIISGQNIQVKNVHTHHNMINGLLITSSAEDIIVYGGSSYNNTIAGVALGGGNSIVLQQIELYNTGSESSQEGKRQDFGILTDNVDDTSINSDGNVTYIEGISHISNLTVLNVSVHDHLKYGIRISASNADLSNLSSDRITTRNIHILDSTFLRNGIALDNFVGGLYHYGNILLQHVERGLVQNNIIRNGYTWGIDAYSCNNIIYRDNYIIDNDLGKNTPNITFPPSGIEINGGHNNIFENNLVTGNAQGLFSSYIPDTGDNFDRKADQYDSYNGRFSLTIRNNILLDNNETSITNEQGVDINEPGVDYLFLGDDSFVRLFYNNIIGTVPEYLGGDPAVLSSTFTNDNPNYTLKSSELFVDPSNGNFSIQPSSPIFGINIGPNPVIIK